MNPEREHKSDSLRITISTYLVFIQFRRYKIHTWSLNLKVSVSVKKQTKICYKKYFLSFFTYFVLSYDESTSTYDTLNIDL